MKCSFLQGLCLVCVSLCRALKWYCHSDWVLSIFLYFGYSYNCFLTTTFLFHNLIRQTLIIVTIIMLISLTLTGCSKSIVPARLYNFWVICLGNWHKVHRVIQCFTRRGKRIQLQEILAQWLTISKYLTVNWEKFDLKSLKHDFWNKVSQDEPYYLRF